MQIFAFVIRRFLPRAWPGALEDSDEISLVGLNAVLAGERAPQLELLAINRRQILAQLDLKGFLVSYRGECTPSRAALNEVGVSFGRHGAWAAGPRHGIAPSPKCLDVTQSLPVQSLYADPSGAASWAIRPRHHGVSPSRQGPPNPPIWGGRVVPEPGWRMPLGEELSVRERADARRESE